MKTRTAIPKLSSKNRYRATAAEVRLYGGKTVTDFLVMWDPADAATWTIERGLEAESLLPLASLSAFEPAEMFYDEGPVYLLPNVGTYLGPSYGDGWYDGFSPFASNVLYKTIYNELERRKGGGPDRQAPADPAGRDLEGLLPRGDLQ